jgi:flagellar biosynthetic protein FliR
VYFFELMQNQLGFFLLMFARITGIFTSAPVFGSHNIPVVVKASLSLLMTYMMLPLFFNNQPVPDGFFSYILMVIGEFLLGLIIGFASSLVFSGVQMAGHLLDIQIGFGIVNTMDPQFGQQIPLLGNFKYIFALMLFLATNGHHILLSAIFSSFKLVPVTGIVFNTNIVDMIVNMVIGVFVIAFKISLPILIALFLTDVALGILARTMPQMNIFVVGIPGKIIVGIFVLSLALPFYMAFLEVVFNGMYSDLYRLLEIFR